MDICQFTGFENIYEYNLSSKTGLMGLPVSDPEPLRIHSYPIFIVLSWSLKMLSLIELVHI